MRWEVPHSEKQDLNRDQRSCPERRGARQVWGVEAIGFHFYDTLKIILSFSAWRVGLERVEAT